MLSNGTLRGPEDLEELGSLISFANLEHVVKHIIRKFKSLEAYNESNDATIKSLKGELEARETHVAPSYTSQD